MSGEHSNRVFAPVWACRYGCRVAQRLFERVPVQLLENLYNELFPNFTELAQDQFGNYVRPLMTEAWLEAWK